MDLGSVLGRLPKVQNADLLVGTETFDDAGVFRLDAERALVMTVDLITPVSNDPYLFGQVAAANSLSDVFAMGGTVTAVLNVCCFPESLPTDVMTEILKGAQSKVAECGAILLGGHTVEDEDLKFGLSVTGFVHPDKILRNVGAQIGDALVLSKPLGTGVGISAEKIAIMDKAHHDEMLDQLASLNLIASQAALKYGAHAATDITGFGLAGHGFEMANGSSINLRFQIEKLPVYSWFEDYWTKGARTKVTPANRRLVGEHLIAPENTREVDYELFCDPQTSGGLLIALPPENAESLVQDLKKQGLNAACIIGEVVAGTGSVEFVNS